MSERKLIKSFNFTTRNRPKLVFSDSTKIRLNDDDKLDQGLTLKGPPYDLGLSNTVTTWVVAPKAMKRWLMFEAEEIKPTNTSIGYRVLRGVDELYWDGGAWSPATTDAHWSDLPAMNANLQALVPTGFDLKIKVNLRTTDQAVSPKVRWIKILALTDFDSWDDLIYDTVIRSMRSTLRATTAIQFEVAATTSVIDLASTYKIENSGYNFTGVRAAYNLTTDPNSFTNIALSYTPGAINKDGTNEDGQITLSVPVNAGEILRLEMEYEPEVAVFTNQDYYEVARVPAIVFEQVASAKLFNRHDQELNDAEGDSVRDLVNGTAVEVPRPRQTSVRFDFAVHASPLDMARLIDAMDKWVANNRLLKTWGFDDEVNMDPVSEIDTSDSTNIEDVVMATGSFQLRGVPFYVRESKDVNLITNVNLNLIP